MFGVLFLIHSVPESKWIHILVILLSSVVVAWAAIRAGECSLKEMKGMKLPPNSRHENKAKTHPLRALDVGCQERNHPKTGSLSRFR